MNLKEGYVFKTKKNELFYEITTVGQSLISAKRLDKKGFLHLTFGIFEKEVDVLYTEEKEIKAIKNTIAEEKLKAEEINIEEFNKMNINERMKILDEKDISYTEKVDLIKYKNIDYKKVQKKIKTTMPVAIELWEKGREGIFRNINAMIKLNEDMQDIVNEIKHCWFCKGIEGNMLQSKIDKTIHAHPDCLEKARKQVDEARKRGIGYRQEEIMQFSKELKQLRKKLGFSQSQLAKFSGFSLKSIQAWEQKYRTPPKAYQKIIIEKLKRELNIQKQRKK